jgi:hypothetical protein
MAGSDRRQAFAAQSAAIAQDGAATARGPACAESVLTFASDFRWLILAFHKFKFMSCLRPSLRNAKAAVPLLSKGELIFV